MEPLMAAALFGVAAGVLSWAVVHRYQNQRVILQRILKHPAHTDLSPTAEDATHLSFTKDRELTLENMMSDKLTRDLFVAGLRSSKHVGLFKLVFRLAIIAPLTLVGLHLLMGSLSGKNLVEAFILGSTIFVFAHFFLKRAVMKRKKRILRALPQFLDLLVVCVEAGLNFMAAMERVLKEMDPNEPLVKEFQIMYHEFMGGLSLGEATERLAKRCDVAEITVLLNFIVQSDQMGASLGANLRVHAAEMRDEFRQRMRTRAHQIPVKIIFPTMLIFFTIFIITLGPAFYQLTHTMAKISLSGGPRR